MVDRLCDSGDLWRITTVLHGCCCCCDNTSETDRHCRLDLIKSRKPTTLIVISFFFFFLYINKTLLNIISYRNISSNSVVSVTTVARRELKHIEWSYTTRRRRRRRRIHMTKFVLYHEKHERWWWW